MKKLNKEYILTTLQEQKLWKAGESDTFSFNGWELTLRREEKNYEPFTYSVSGKKENSCQTWGRRYIGVAEAFLHIVNRFNENANIKNKYNTINDYILEK